MSDIDLQHHLPNYRAELFADRREAIQEVTGAVAKLFIEADAREVLAFRGGRGLGKSWLAFHLVRTVALAQFPKDVLCLFIGLGEAYVGRVIDSSLDDGREWLLEEHISRASDGKIDTAATLRGLLTWFAKKIGAVTASDVSLAQLAAWVVHRLKQPTCGDLNQYCALVCILDSAYEADKVFRMELEKVLLHDLAQLERVLLVITGRGNKPDWSSYYLRHYERAISLGSLHDKNQEEIKQKIAAALSESLQEDIDLASLDQLLNEAGWLPLNTILTKLAEEKVISWETALDELLRFVPAKERESIRQAAVALSVLQGFRKSELKLIQQEGPAPVDPQAVLDTLLAYQLASWDSKKGWWILDRSMCALARLYLKKKQPDYLRRLHASAHNMYALWAQKYNVEDYREHAAYHANELGSEGSVQAPALSREEGDLA